MNLNDVPTPFLAHLKPGSRPGSVAVDRLPVLDDDARTSHSPAGVAIHPPAAPVAPGAGAQPTWPAVLEWQTLALREATFEAAATTVLAALAVRLQAHRVSLLVRHSPKQAAGWVAASDGVDRDARVAVQRQLLNAADEVMDRPQLLEAPHVPGTRAVPAHALATLLSGNEVPACLGMAFDMPEGARGALIAELRQPPSLDARSLLQDAAWFVGPVLLLKRQAETGWLRAWQRMGQPFDSRSGRRRWSKLAIAATVVCVALVVAVAVPSTHHVVAQGRIEGHGQRVVPAPLDGFLASVAVRPGEAVREGQVLAQLDNKDAALQAERTQAERSQFERQYLDALTREDAAATEIARAKLEQARAADALAQARLALSQLTAPFDGVVISGDLVSLVGGPVKRGQELMVVAPSSTWRVVAEVDEADIGHIRAGQAARLLLASQGQQTAAFTVQRISPVAQPSGGRNVFEVEGLLAPADAAVVAAQWRPGQQGIVRIAVGERAPAAVWWERAGHALRRLLWSLMA